MDTVDELRLSPKPRTGRSFGFLKSIRDNLEP